MHLECRSSFPFRPNQSEHDIMPHALRWLRPVNKQACVDATPAAKTSLTLTQEPNIQPREGCSHDSLTVNASNRQYIEKDGLY